MCQRPPPPAQGLDALGPPQLPAGGVGVPVDPTAVAAIDPAPPTAGGGPPAGGKQVLVVIARVANNLSEA